MCSKWLLLVFASVLSLTYSSRNAGDDDLIRRKAKANLKASLAASSAAAKVGGDNQAATPVVQLPPSTEIDETNNSSKAMHEQINHLFDELAKHKVEMEATKSKYEDELFNKESSWKAMLEGIHTPEQQNSTEEKAKLDKCKFDIQANNNLQSSQRNHASLELSAAHAKAKRENDMILTKIAELQTATDHIYNYDQVINISPKDQTKRNEKRIQGLKSRLEELESDLKSLHNNKDDRIYIIDMNHYKSKIWTYGCSSSLLVLLFVVLYFALTNLNQLKISLRMVPSSITKPLTHFPYFLSLWMFALVVLSLIWSSDPLDSMSSFYNVKTLTGHKRYVHNDNNQEIISNLWWSDVNTSVQSEFCIFFTSYFWLMVLSCLFITMKFHVVHDYKLACSIRAVQLTIILGMALATSFWTNKSLLMESTSQIESEIIDLVDKGQLHSGGQGKDDDGTVEESGVKPALNYLSIGLAFLLLGYLEHLISQKPVLKKAQSDDKHTFDFGVPP
jgi:hypothetical protein